MDYRIPKEGYRWSESSRWWCISCIPDMEGDKSKQDMEGDKYKLEHRNSREKMHWKRLSLRCQLPLYHFLNAANGMPEWAWPRLLFVFALPYPCFDGVSVLLPNLLLHSTITFCPGKLRTLIKPYRNFLLDLLQVWRWALVNLKAKK